MWLQTRINKIIAKHLFRIFRKYWRSISSVLLIVGVRTNNSMNIVKTINHITNINRCELMGINVNKIKVCAILNRFAIIMSIEYWLSLQLN